MTSNKQSLKFACSAVLGASLMVAVVGQSAAGGNRTFAGPPAGTAQVQRLFPAALRDCSTAVGRSALFAQTIPIRMTVSSGSISSGDVLNCTVTVQSVPTGGGYVQIMCDTPGALSSGSGSWPYGVYFAPGSSTTASFNVTANSVSNSTNVTIYYGTANADPNDPSDWTAGGAVTVTPA